MDAAALLKKLSLEEKIAQLLVVGFDGPAVSDHLGEMLEMGAGGVIYFGRNVGGGPGQILDLSREIHKRSRFSRPLIGIDQEPGLVVRLREPFTEWPGARAIGTRGEPALALEVGRAIARELKAVGVSADWAPVVDVDSNPANPIIGARSFGSEPALVSKLGRAFVRGMQGAGVAACAKHFPGHGETRADSHLTLPVVEKSRRQLSRCELAPFAAAVRERVATVMTAHVRYPALDEDAPATISHKIVTGLLRRKMGYRGVVVTDDLAMMGIAAGRSHEEIGAAAIAAGCDLLLAGQDFRNQRRFIAGVAEAVRAGEIPLRRIHESLRRVWKLKARFAGAPPARLSTKWIGSAAHKRLAEEFAAAG